jgi:hypothetical protein
MTRDIPDTVHKGALKQASLDHSTSEALLRCIDLHARSSARDLQDAQFDRAAMKNDKASTANASSVQSVDSEILAKLGKNGTVGSLSKDLVNRAIAAHQGSNKFTQRDLDGPSGGIGSGVSAGNDKTDSASEDALIKTNNGLIGKNLSRTVSAQLDWDNTNKGGLKFNENKDAKLEPAYAAHDVDDLKFNKVALDALSGHIHLSHTQLVELFKSDSASKKTISADRNADYANEQKYRHDDLNDHQQNMHINQMLQAQLAKDVYSPT